MQKCLQFPAMESAFKKRLARLVDVVFEGNVYSAARAAGIPQPTLQRLLEGTTAQPRIGTVKRLADGYGVPMGWLLGELPSEGAQGPMAALPEPLWLIQAHYRSAQRGMRMWIRNARAPDEKAKEIIQYFQDFSISPLEGYPNQQFTDELFKGDELDAYSLSLLKGSLSLETELLLNAVRLLRRMGVKSQKRKVEDDTL